MHWLVQATERSDLPDASKARATFLLVRHYEIALLKSPSDRNRRKMNGYRRQFVALVRPPHRRGSRASVSLELTLTPPPPHPKGGGLPYRPCPVCDAKNPLNQADCQVC